MTLRGPLLQAAFARVGYPPDPAARPRGGSVRITHPVPGYTGPVSAAGLRLHFVAGTVEATNLKAGVRRALEDAGFTVESPRAAKADDEGGDG